MKNILLALLFTSFYFNLHPQDFSRYAFQNLGELEKNLTNAKTNSDKTNALIWLYLYHSQLKDSANIAAANNYFRQLETFTHETNDPELRARAMYWEIEQVNTNEEVEQRIQILSDYAKLNKLDFYRAVAKTEEAFYYGRLGTENAKAVECINDAVTIAKDLNSDSLKSYIYLRAAYRSRDFNNYLAALKFAFQGQELALKAKSIELQQIAMNAFATTYYFLHDYEKSAAYYLKEIKLIEQLKQPFLAALRHARVARNYYWMHETVLWQYHVDEAFRLADSIKANRRLFNEIIGITVSNLTYTNKTNQLKILLKKYRQYFFTFPGSDFLDNVTLARAYRQIGNLDSAEYFIRSAAKFLSPDVGANNQKTYFYTAADIAVDQHNLNEAKNYYRQSLQIALMQHDLNAAMPINDSLKNISLRQNNFTEAVQYYKLGDSLQTERNIQADKEEITHQEVAALEKQKQMEEEQQEKEKQQRYNLQYLAITFVVVALFITLILMGLFTVSAKTIRVLGFFSFLLFFEFIFLIFKKQIDSITHGEPWMDLGLMVLLAAIMVPLHHWAEHTVIHYLSSNKLKLPNKKVSSHLTKENNTVK